MEKWEEILRQSDAKVRDLPAKPENWERLAADLGTPPPASASPGGWSAWRRWFGWGGAGIGLITVVVATQLALSDARLSTPDSPAPVTETRSETPLAPPVAEPGAAPSGLAAATEEATRPALRGESRSALRNEPRTAPTQAARNATDFSAPEPAAAPTGPVESDRVPAPEAVSATATDDRQTATTNSAGSVPPPAAPDRGELPSQETVAQRLGTAELLPASSLTPLTTRAATLPDMAPLTGNREYRWRLRLNYGFVQEELDPPVPFYRLEQEIPNQVTIRPELGPEELFLVGEFRALEAEEISNDYRLTLEHRVASRLWIYGGVRHQRLVYRLDEDRTDYTGTDADLLFRGRIRYRETGLETGISYRFAQIAGRFFPEIRAGLHYVTERHRVFDGTLQNREQSGQLPFRYREELLPKYRLGYQLEILTHYQLNDRLSINAGSAFFLNSSGILRSHITLLGLARKF